MERPLLRDVADLAGVSLATASRVLNAKGGVAPATRRRVVDALEQLGYTVPDQGRSRRPLVGIITPELDNPIFPVLAQGVEAALARRGLVSLICASTPSTVRESDYLSILSEVGVTGVVVVNGRYSLAEVGYDPYVRLAATGTRVVLVNAVTADCPVPAVSVDVAEAGRMAVEHLTTLGHVRVGLVSGTRRYITARQLRTGYEAGLREASLPIGEGLVSDTLYTIEGGRAAASKLLEAGVTAIVCGGDLLALGVIAAVRDGGRRVPEEVSVVGFDGTRIVSFTDPPLTSIRQPVGRMAATVAELIQRPSSTAPTVHMFEPELVVGRSTSRAPTVAPSSSTPPMR